MTISKIVPKDFETEQALLGSILLYENSMRIVAEDGLHHDDFYDPNHKIIFEAMSELYDANKPIDITTLQSILNDKKLLIKIGGLDYLSVLQDASVTSIHSKHYSDIIQKKALARKLIETAHNISETGYNSAVDIEELLDNAEKNILGLTRNRKSNNFIPIKEIAHDYYEKVTLMRENKSSITGVKTGYKQFDRKTNGLQRGDLVIVAARPSVGKTALALNIAAKTAKNNPEEAVGIFSLEMSPDKLVERMVSADCKIPINNLKTGYLKSDKEMNSLKNSIQKLRQYKLFIDESSFITVPEIFSACRKLHSEHGLSLIIIDYIQLISGNRSKGDNRQQEVAEISRSLKALARELNVPVIALSQLSRNVEQRTDKRPMLSDLRESGAIEQDADIVILLHREDYQKKDEPNEQVVELIFAKHRNGATGSFEMMFTKNTNCFVDIENSFTND